jgi:WXG100 family type VII secretion target
MADKIRVNYPALEEMAKQCEMVNSRLTELASTEGKLSQQMQGGALLGPPGDAFVAVLATFSQKITRLADKFAEEAKDIRQSMTDMRDADSSAAGGFK